MLDVVPRAWAHLLAIVSGTPLEPEQLTSAGWRDRIAQIRGVPALSSMTDGRNPAYRDWSEGYDPASWLDRSIQATRVASFPLLGLDPQP